MLPRLRHLILNRVSMLWLDTAFLADLNTDHPLAEIVIQEIVVVFWGVDDLARFDVLMDHPRLPRLWRVRVSLADYTNATWGVVVRAFARLNARGVGIDVHPVDSVSGYAEYPV